MKLYELPRNTPLRIWHNEDWSDAVFHHVDGMYSYCTLGTTGETLPYATNVFHIKAWAEMKEIDGRWHIEDEDKND